MLMREYSKMSLLYRNETEELFFYKGKLFYFNTNQKQTCSLHCGFFSRFHFSSRLMRLEPRIVSKLSNNDFLIAHKGKIYNYSPSSNSLTIEHCFCSGMSAPLYFCEKTTNGIIDIFYGEYYQKTSGKPLAIFKRNGADKKWSKVFEFAPGTIKHIHNILFDEAKSRFLIFTGDNDSESGIWEADLDFKKVKPILCGSQNYRACFGFIKGDWLYYLTDMPDKINSAFKVNLNTREIVLLDSIAGPCIHGVALESNCFFATSVEPKSTLGKIRYFLSTKPGDGISDRFSHLYRFDGDKVFEISKIKKDAFPFALFQFGDIFFSKGMHSDVFFYTQALKHGYGKTYVIKEGEI